MPLLNANAADRRDPVVWKWRRGDPTPASDFGDPLAADVYTLCLYDLYPAQATVAAQAPAAGICAGKPCWKAMGSPPGSKGFQDADKQRPPAQGVDSIQLRPGADKKARVSVKGRGGNLGMAAPPHDTPVDVQLRASNGECWESVFYPPGVRKNDAGRFKAKQRGSSGSPWPLAASGYPRSFLSMRFVRQLHDDHPELDYADLEQVYGAFHGILAPSNHFTDYVQFKNEHPEKWVQWFHELSVFSEGQTKYDIVDRTQFFAGHWVYFEGSLVTGDIPATSGETEIAVAHPERFFIQHLGPGGWTYVQDDIALCALDAGGLPAGHHLDQ